VAKDKMGKKAAGEEDAKTRASQAFSAITPLLGLGAQIYSGIQATKKPPKVSAGNAAYGYQHTPAALAAQGHGMGRGPALLGAYRAAGKIGPAMAEAHGRQNLLASAQNVQNTINRRDKVGAFGMDMAAGAAQIGVGLADIVNARKAKKEEDALAAQGQTAVQGTPLMQGADATGLGQPMGPGAQAQPEPMPPEELASVAMATQDAALEPLMLELDKWTQREIRNNAEALEQVRGSLGLSAPEAMQLVAPQMEGRARRLNVAMDIIAKDGGDTFTLLPLVARQMGIDLISDLNPPLQQYQWDTSNDPQAE
jgi:hypothetical protein